MFVESSELSEKFRQKRNIPKVEATEADSKPIQYIAYSLGAIHP